MQVDLSFHVQLRGVHIHSVDLPFCFKRCARCMYVQTVDLVEGINLGPVPRMSRYHYFRHWASFVIISTQRFELRRHMWCIRSIWLLRCACILRAWCCSILYVALHGDVARRVFRIPVLYISPSPLKLLLQNAMPPGRYRMVFGYYHFDLG